MQISRLNYNIIKLFQQSKAKAFIPSTLDFGGSSRGTLLISLFLRVNSFTTHSRGADSNNLLFLMKISFFFDFFKTVQNISKSQPEILVRVNILKCVKNWFTVRFRRFWVDLGKKYWHFFPDEIFDFGSLCRLYHKSIR